MPLLESLLLCNSSHTHTLSWLFSAFIRISIRCATNASVITENWKQYQVKDGCFCFWYIINGRAVLLKQCSSFRKSFHLRTCYLWYVMWWWPCVCMSFARSFVLWFGWLVGWLAGGSLSFLKHVSNSSQTIQRQFATAWTLAEWNHVNLITRHSISPFQAHRKTLNLFLL